MDICGHVLLQHDNDQYMVIYFVRNEKYDLYYTLLQFVNV